MSRRSWTKEETDFLKENYSKMKMIRLCRELKRDNSSIIHKAIRMSLKSYYRNGGQEGYWNKKEIEILKEKFEKTLVEDLAEQMNRTEGSIKAKAHELNLKSDRSFKQMGKGCYLANETFFDVPNLLNSYWAGFIAADGCIIDKKSGQKSLTIGIAKQDLNILKKFKKDIDFKGKIGEREINFPNAQNCVSIYITSDKICNDLHKNFNITPRKSLTLQPPSKLNKKQALAFIIGYIDGDGCITTGNRGNTLSFYLLGTKVFLEWIHTYVIKICKKEHWNKVPIYQRHNHFAYYLHCKKADMLLRKLDSLKLSVMNRKWKKLKEFKDGKRI